ncbi:hypothetical protein [Roseivirga sp.]|uniref:hypothetical protein n=1 Tax=Roseivirga sp. TaxID=1964215 RepID=UPI003B8AFFBE
MKYNAHKSERYTTLYVISATEQTELQMPFSCKFQLNNGAITEHEEVKFEEFTDSSFGDFHQNSVKIAKVLVNGKPAFIASTCPCFPSSKNKGLKLGDRLDSHTVIGYFLANGEDIPYEKPYAQIVLE